GQSTRDLAGAAWQRSPEGRAGRAAPLLAVRAARRAVLANPDDYEAYGNLAKAYRGLDADAGLALVQRVVAARQALARLPAAAARYPPPRRARYASQFGLVREAIKALREADPGQLDAQAVQHLLHLLLLAGEAEAARAALKEPSLNPVTVLPPPLQPGFRELN